MGIVVPYLMNGTGRLDCSSEDMWPLLPVRTLSDVQLSDISMINWYAYIDMQPGKGLQNGNQSAQ
jgi:hypothetical protein